ncbi:MAG: DUF1269 domain-containing protein [Firmicutes bacterium]|uniref:DUF1269 domain-containing protein n=1 Tax=Sulfobacillus benefaciens TaxID=453960 RepID=A0A2T2X1G5_9FIRM|nr:DUF1269 domain-containing protein [Bacillota bacterium]MCL5012845.1 DUF1269 domain-containing protein [Bacillota bacterium]PSR28325.1 MAG: DUF1269 domain-containing protein [Sulfobacillus benefaciens]HBQ95544.1 DUF1269 domain-containing protein [Sulfobacillus sp.]
MAAELHDRHQAHVAATFKTYVQAEEAVRGLIDNDIPVENISLVGKNFSIKERPLGYTTISGVAKQGSKFGALWGGVLGLLMGFTILFSPTAGPLVLFGPLAYALTTAVEGAVFGGLAGILVGWGMKHEKAIWYQRSIEQGDYLVTVSGDEALVNKAYWLLKKQDSAQVDFLTSDNG